MVSITGLTRRLDKLDETNDAKRYQALCDRFFDEHGWPRIDCNGATCIEDMLAMLRQDEAQPETH